jgi:hypothetical protein
MGKTSLAREVLRRLGTAQGRPVGGYITLDAVGGPPQAYARIIEESAADGTDQQPVARATSHDDAYEAFLQTLRRRSRAGQRSTVLVDEVDAITREGFADAPLFVSRLREVANDRDRYGLTFVFISRRSLDMIQGAVDCSTLAGLCEVLYIRPLDRAGLSAMAARSPSNLPVESEGLEALWGFTGGQPFLAEVVLCEAVERGASPLGSEALAAAQHAQSHEFTNHYRQLARLLEHDQMFNALCELVVGPRWRPISPHIEGLLKHYGLLRSRAGGGDGVECMSQHVHEYLALLARATPSWTLLGEAERQLRALVEDRLVSAYGDAWLDSLRYKYPSLRDALDRLVQQRDRERRMFGDAASDSILDYTYLRDLKEVIFLEWDRFRSVLGGSESDWKERFQDIMKVRNPMAHNRAVPADVLQNAERSCRSLLGRLAGGVAPQT